MPSKTPKQIKKAKRIAKRGETDLVNGHVTPRALRFALGQGAYSMSRKTPPEPPDEWRQWKRDRFEFSIRAAVCFLRGKELCEIGPLIGKGVVGKDVTRQRIAQMVGAGVKFLLDRRFVKAV